MATDHLPERGSKSAVILDAAEKRFAQFGFRRTSIEDVAREAGIAKGTIYLYFASKEALFTGVLIRFLADTERLCDAAETRSAPFPDRLYSLLDAYLGASYERFGRSQHLLELTDSRSPSDTALMDQAAEKYRRRVMAFFNRADHDGEIDIAGSGLSVAAIVETILAATVGAKKAGAEPVEPSIYRRRLVTIARMGALAVRN